MRALYLYFADTAAPGRGPTTAPEDARPMYEVPLTPIRPGAFSRWMASRERNAAADGESRSDVGATNGPRRLGVPNAEGAR